MTAHPSPATPSPAASAESRARRALFWIACFGSIATLLGHLGAVAPMAWLGRYIWLPSSVALFLLYLWALRAGDEAFLLPFRAGWVGGLWGTLGYDLFRIPFHAMGQNPFAPIRSYGMWLAAADHSDTWTDALGALFHFSNGITFGWIYAFLMLRRHWLWGVAWGLGLETLAVLSPFGVVFSLRTQYGVLALAYVAHLFYGYPLGWICRHPETVLSRVLPVGRTERGWLTLFGTVLVFTFLMTAWQLPWQGPPVARANVVVGPDAVYPGWSDLPAGTSITVTNRLTAAATLKWRKPGHQEMTPVVLEPGGAATLTLQETGIHQLALTGSRWRSIFLAIHHDQDYRPR